MIPFLSCLIILLTLAVIGLAHVAVTEQEKRRAANSQIAYLDEQLLYTQSVIGKVIYELDKRGLYDMDDKTGKEVGLDSMKRKLTQSLEK